MDFWNANEIQRRQSLSKTIDVPRLVEVIRFFENAPFRLLNHRVVQMPGQSRGRPGSAKRPEITFDGFAHRWILNFDSDLLASFRLRPVDLPKRSGGERFHIE